MGSISGRSKAPTQPVAQVVYVPTSSTTTTTEIAEPSEEQSLAERADFVLKRSRSRLGTVLTGFQGILSQNDLVAPRKSLLGE